MHHEGDGQQLIRRWRCVWNGCPQNTLLINVIKVHPYLPKHLADVSLISKLMLTPGGYNLRDIGLEFSPNYEFIEVPSVVMLKTLNIIRILDMVPPFLIT
ncbi:hypothetical protein KM043_017912 [Ampulex compressa]|nr:hypothetical protein KM043_017912 [Ampulex compressa]